MQTNANGQASVTVTLPENLTTWQMDVRAVTDSTEVGQNTHDLTSTKPLIVNLQTPRFFVVEDTSLIGALLINNTKEDLDVDVNLEATGVEFNSEQPQTVSVGAGQQSYVTWEVNIPYDSERVDFTVHANSGEYSDASKPAAGTLDNHGIPVFRYATTENIGSSGMLESGESVVEGIQLPTTMEFYEAELMVGDCTFAGSWLTGWSDIPGQLPYDCNEQTASKLLSNLLNYHILQLSGKDPDNLEVLRIKISANLASLYTTQNADGGWGWWPGQKPFDYQCICAGCTP